MKAGEEYQVLGFRISTAKDGKESAILYYVTPFEEWEVTSSNDVQGHKTDHEYTRDPKVIEKVKSLKINDVITFTYRKGFQNTAVVTGISVVKSSGK